MGVMNAFVQSFFEVCCTVLKTFKRELETLAIVIQIAIPIVIATQMDGIGKMVVCSAILNLIVWYVKLVARKLNKRTTDGIPIMQEKLIVEEDGITGIKAGMTQDAILYLQEIQEYFEKKGILKND